LPSDQETPRPACYGALDKVFPMSGAGLREVRDLCWNCALRVECLREAMDNRDQHRTMSEERAKRDTAANGVAGFLQRWSRLKNESKKGPNS
jgi:hypothetical protein